jgi:hypothetical protein
MSHFQQIGTVVIALTLACATLGGDRRAQFTGGEKAVPPRVVRIGAVAYAPSAVTVFENLRRYFAKTDLPVDYVAVRTVSSGRDGVRRSGRASPASWPPPASARSGLRVA